MSTFSGLNIGLSSLSRSVAGWSSPATTSRTRTPRATAGSACACRRDGGPITPAMHSRYDGTGNGVTVADTQRLRDAFLEGRAVLERGTDGSLRSQQTALARVEGVFGEPSDSGRAVAARRLLARLGRRRQQRHRRRRRAQPAPAARRNARHRAERRRRPPGGAVARLARAARRHRRRGQRRPPTPSPTQQGHRQRHALRPEPATTSRTSATCWCSSWRSSYRCRRVSRRDRRLGRRARWAGARSSPAPRRPGSPSAARPA